MVDHIPQLLQSAALPLAEAGMSQREAHDTLRAASGRLAATIASHFRRERGHQGTPLVSLEGLLDIEECIWAPKYGIKGVIDATMLARFPADAQQRQQNATSSAGFGAESGGTLGLVPVEFKSGKRWHSHAAQVRAFP